MPRYIMAIDAGTTSSRCILFDHNGCIAAMAQQEFRQIYPKEGWVEHDPMEILNTQLSVCRQAMAGVPYRDISAIGITNQRETAIVWEKDTGKPVYNAIVWQCRRTAEYCKSLQADTDKIRQKTGLLPDAYFSASKLRWILQNVPGAQERAEKGELLFGTVDTWIIWNLTNGALHITDYTNASRTMLFNINTLEWDTEILQMLSIPAAMLPLPLPSSKIYGQTSLFGGPIPIAGIAGDQQAALFGQACFSPGEAKNTYGTGCFLLMNTGFRPVFSQHGLLTTVACSADKNVQYALEGSVFVAGAVIQWLRDELGLIDSAGQSETLALQSANTGGVYFVPAFVGLGAPWWDSYARGTLVGLTRGTNKSQIVRAALESIAYQTSDVLHAMEDDAKLCLKSLKVDGGACANDFLMQYQADIIHTAISRPACIETTALGASYLAGLAVGFWESQQNIINNWRTDRTFTPEMDEENRNNLLAGWHKAVDCARHWA